MFSVLASERAGGSSSITIKLVQSIMGSGVETLVSSSHIAESIKIRFLMAITSSVEEEEEEGEGRGGESALPENKDWKQQRISCVSQQGVL